jgi:hypothetical protein
MAKNSTFTVPPNPTGIYTISVGTGGSGGTIGAVGGAGGSGYVKSRMVVDHEITGQTIFAEYILPPNYQGMTEAEIKGLLIEKLVHEMYKQKNIEFTRMESVDTDEMVYRARIHVVPDTQVRIIREIKDARKTT